MLNNLIVLIILHYRSTQCKSITLYTLNLYNLVIISQGNMSFFIQGKKQSKIFVIYRKCSFLLKYNFFQFLYTGLLGITVPNSEKERTRNQQMSFPNCPQMCFSVNFTWFFFFSANFNCLFHCPFPTSDEPPISTRTNNFHFACIRTRIQDTLSF